MMTPKQTEKPKVVSLIVACRNEGKYIEDVLKSLLSQDYHHERFEILVIDGRSEDSTVSIIKQMQLQYSNIRFLDNPLKTATHAFNIGIQNAVGDFIFIIGSHCEYPKNYISKLVSSAQEFNASVAGGVLLTAIKKNNSVSNAIKKVLSNKIGVGNSSFRTGVNEIKEVDTVPYGCYKKDVFEKYGLFNELLIRNQDIEFNKRIVNNKGKIIIVPDVIVTYYARESLKEVIKNNYENGFWNPLTVFYTSSFKSISLRHYIPMMFIMFIIIFSLLSFLSIYFFIALVSISLLYLLIIGLVSYSIKDGSTKWLQLLKTFLSVHFSYGIGSLVGTYKAITLKIRGSKHKS
jgi:glycosyltransferase involved in cell wall biosynthesis